MKILQVVQRFPPAVRGGAMGYTFELARELAKSHDVHILFTRKDLGRPQYEVAEGEYEGLPFTEIIHNGLYDSFERTYRDERIDAVFVQLLDRLQPDFVHVQHLLFLSANLVHIARQRRLPVIFTLHDFWLMCPREIRMKPDQSLCFEVEEEVCSRCVRTPPMTSSRMDVRLHRALKGAGALFGSGAIEGLRRLSAFVPASATAAARRLLRLTRRSPSGSAAGAQTDTAAIDARNAFLKQICAEVDLFVSPSRFLREDFIRFGIPADRILASPHGHDLGWTPRQRKPRGERLRFGYVGMLARHKGVGVVIEAFDALDPGEAELFVFGGANVNLAFARALQRSARNPGIHFMGPFDHDERGRVFAQFDVLVMPSLCFENAPMTICEAFAAGIPVVTSRLGGMAELVEDGINGLLFEPGSAADLEAKLRRLIKQPQLVDELAAGIAPVKAIEQDARDLCERVAALGRGADRAGTRSGVV